MKPLLRRVGRWTMGGTLAAATLVAAPLHAQAPRAGKYYEDAVDLGFKVKVPKDWDSVPPSPLERNVILKFAPQRNPTVNMGGGSHVALNVWLVKFDQRPGFDGAKIEREIEGETVEIAPPAKTEIVPWIEEDVGQGNDWTFDEEDYPRPLKSSKVPARYYVFEADASIFSQKGADPKRIRSYAAVFDLADGLQVALVGTGPGDSKKWKSYEKAFASMAKTFRPVEVEARDVSILGGGSPRIRKRQKLELDVAKNPEWKLYETENYFVVTNNEDEDFIEELLERLEAIRTIYLQDYPPETARRAVVRPAAADTEEAGAEKAQEHDSEAAPVDPMEASRTSVVRVCKNRGQYMQYGGPPGSAGYWNWVEEELVIFDDKERGGRRNTWATLNHEAFHQYIFYFYGNISPHSWYNEGTGDFYSGYEYKYGKFKLKKFDWRVGTVTTLLNEERTAPLEAFVRYTKDEYYDDPEGKNPHGLGGGECYAQGWAFIYFLRTGKEEAKGWNDDWDDILEVYLRKLAESGDLDAAVDEAFGSVDWDELERVWKEHAG